MVEVLPLLPTMTPIVTFGSSTHAQPCEVIRGVSTFFYPYLLLGVELMALLCRPAWNDRGHVRASRIEHPVGSQRGVPGLDHTHNQVHFYIQLFHPPPNGLHPPQYL